MLPSRELSFSHPSTNHSVSFSATIPGDMDILIKKLGAFKHLNLPISLIKD